MKISVGSLITTALALILGSCATTPPLQSEAGFSPNQMDKVYVLLPVVDDRVDTTKKVDMDRIDRKVTEISRDQLAGKHYPAEFETDPSPISGQDLKAGNVEALTKVEPPDARWVIVFTLDKFTTNMILGSFAAAEITMRIVDLQSKRVVWQDTGIGSAGGSGLIYMMMVGPITDQALDDTLGRIFKKIPKKT